MKRIETKKINKFFNQDNFDDQNGFTSFKKVTFATCEDDEITLEMFNVDGEAGTHFIDKKGEVYYKWINNEGDYVIFIESKKGKLILINN